MKRWLVITIALAVLASGCLHLNPLDSPSPLFPKPPAITQVSSLTPNTLSKLGATEALTPAGRFFPVKYIIHSYSGFSDFVRSMWAAFSLVPIQIGATTLPFVDSEPITNPLPIQENLTLQKASLSSHFVFLPLIVSHSQNSEWTQHAHDAQRSGYTDQVVPPPWRWKWAWNGPDVDGNVSVDKFRLPRNSQPVTGGGRVYVAAGSRGVYALSETSGSGLWNRNPGGSINSTPAFDYDTGALFVVSSNGTLYKLDASNGNIIARFPTGASSNLPLPPAIVSDRVLFSMGNRVYAVNKRTMGQIWAYDAGLTVDTPPAYSPSRDLVIAVSRDLYVHAIHNSDGTQAWRVKPTVRNGGPPDENIPNQAEVSYGWPVVAEGHGYVLVKLRLDWDALWTEYPPRNEAIRQYLEDNPAYQSLFVLDLDDGSVPFIANIGHGGFGDGGYLPMGPQPVVRRFPDGQEVVYTVVRGGAIGDPRWDSHPGEMVLDSTTVPGLLPGYVRWIDEMGFSNGSMFFPTDEQPYVSMAGDYLFYAHWEAGAVYRIVDRSGARGSYSNPIVTEFAPAIATSQDDPACPFSPSHYCSDGLTNTRDYPPGFYIYYGQGAVYDQYWTEYAAWVVSNGAVYFVSTDGAVVALEAGNPTAPALQEDGAVRAPAQNHAPQRVLPTAPRAVETSVAPTNIPVISYIAARQHAGEYRTVVGTIRYVFNNGKAVYLGFRNPHQGAFKVRILREDWGMFPASPETLYWGMFPASPETLYATGQQVRVTGRIAWYQGDTVIHVTRPAQIQIVGHTDAQDIVRHFDVPGVPTLAELADGGYALQFYGNGVDDIDRVKVQIDPHVPADVSGDFTIEFWMKTAATGGSCSSGPDGAGWISGRIIIDRDVYGNGDHGDYGISLANGRICFGVERESSGRTIYGSTNVANGQWRHIAVTRRASDGQMRIFVDGQIDAEGTGPTGDISYRDERATDYPNSDPFLVIGAEKHDAGSEYPSYIGLLDDIRISNVVRYDGAFPRPSAPHAADGNTVVLYRFDEGGGTTIIDSAPGGASPGERRVGGSPAGPVYVTDTPFGSPPLPPPPALVPRVYLPLVLRDFGPPEILPRINAPRFSGAIPFEQTAIAWFGKVTPAQNYADIRVGYNADELYVYLAIFDRALWYDENPTSQTLTQWDAVTLLLDTSGSGTLTPSSWRFVAQLYGDRSPVRRAVDRGSGLGWQPTHVPFDALPGWRGNALNEDSDSDRGWAMGFTIPFSSLGLPSAPAEGTTWRMAVIVHDRDSYAGPPVGDQSWPPRVSPDSPATWGGLRFGLPTYTASATPTGSLTIRRPTQNSPLVPDANVGGAIANQCPGDEYHIWNEWGNRNYGTAPDFNIQNQSDVADWPCFAKYYVTFPLDGIPPGKAMISATLTLHQFGNAGGPGEAHSSWIQVLTTSGDWQEGTITWNNAPLAKENIGGSWVAPITHFSGWPGVPRTWDVSYAVARAYARRQPLHLVLYEADSAYHSGKYFVSSDTGDWNEAGRPYLTIVWGVP